ncbi:MAG: rhodanese-like domain-containing protein [Burkholderiales bacterium]
MAFVEKNWLLVLTFVASGLMLLWPLVSRRLSPVKEIGTAVATRLINRENAVLLDVREAAELESGKLPNAVHVPLSQLKERAGELGKYASRPVIVYCARGQRSRSAAGTLAKAGIANIYQLQGGLKAWKDAGLPLESAKS